MVLPGADKDPPHMRPSSRATGSPSCRDCPGYMTSFPS